MSSSAEVQLDEDPDGDDRNDTELMPNNNVASLDGSFCVNTAGITTKDFGDMKSAKLLAVIRPSLVKSLRLRLAVT